MKEISAQPRIVCFGRDAELLTIRLYVLALTYDAVRVGSVAELADLPAQPPFQVVLLCHTLSPEEFCASVEIVRDRWPEAKVMLLSTGLSNTEHAKADAVVFTARGPAALLQSIDQLIG